MSDRELEIETDAPEEFTLQQGMQRDEELRKVQKENKARVVREGKERRRQWAQKLTPWSLPKEQITKDETKTEMSKVTEDNKGMLPDDIVKLLAANEKKVFTSDSEDEKTENRPASRKRRQKKYGLEPVILKDIPSAQCVQNSLEFLKKRKMQVSRSSAVLNNSNQALRLLSKSAGVQCAGNPHFWVNEDGSNQEEGQKNTKGYIWGKAGTKLLCAVLSLPVPSKSSHPFGEQVNSTVSRTMPDYLEHRAIQKLLLIGYSGSGTSTIFKQAKILYKDVSFSEDEREHIKSVIQGHAYSYIGLILEGRERFEEESLNELRQNQSCDDPTLAENVDANGEETLYSICPRLKAFSDWLLKIMASGTLEAIFPAASREYAPIVEELWSNVAFQATYKRRNELESLPSIASYFLERAVDILKPDYKPSDVDILYAERVTSSNGLSCVDFSFPELAYDDDAGSGDLHDSLLRFQLIRLQAKGFGENCKWLQMFEDVRIVIFCVSLSEYDQFATDGDGNSLNKMLLSKKFFETMVTHPTFDQMDFLLLIVLTATTLITQPCAVGFSLHCSEIQKTICFTHGSKAVCITSEGSRAN